MVHVGHSHCLPFSSPNNPPPLSLAFGQARSEVLSVTGRWGWEDQPLRKVDSGALGCARTHLCHIEQEELQVEGRGAGGHLIGDPPNAIANLRAEREAAGSSVLGRHPSSAPPSRHTTAPPNPRTSRSTPRSPCLCLPPLSPNRPPHVIFKGSETERRKHDLSTLPGGKFFLVFPPQRFLRAWDFLSQQAWGHGGSGDPHLPYSSLGDPE